VCIDCPRALANDLMGAFPTLVSHHQDLVYGLARRYSRDASDAEDLAQETFLRAYRALRGFEPERTLALHLRGWLARITLNLARNRARKRQVATAALEAMMERPDAQALGPARSTEERESIRMWRRLLAALPGPQRAAVGLRHVDGLSYPEVATALDRPIGTVKSDVHRGVRTLRRAYKAEIRDTREPDSQAETNERAWPMAVVRSMTEVGTR